MSCSRTTKFNATVHLTMKCIEEMKQTLMKNIQVLIFSFWLPVCHVLPWRRLLHQRVQSDTKKVYPAMLPPELSTKFWFLYFLGNVFLTSYPKACDSIFQVMLFLPQSL